MIASPVTTLPEDEIFCMLAIMRPVSMSSDSNWRLVFMAGMVTHYQQTVESDLLHTVSAVSPEIGSHGVQ